MTRWERKKNKCLQITEKKVKKINKYILKKQEKNETKRKSHGEKKKTGRKRGQMSEQGFSSAVGVKENATNNEMSILPTSSLSLALLRLFSSGPHYQCT